MKKLLLLLILVVPIIINAQTPVPPGAVSGTWDTAGSPYMVNGEIYVAEGTSLEIQPGVEVRFTGWYKFIVNGSLTAVGTELKKILFTANDTNNRWHGIRFIETTDTSILEYCTVEYGLTVLDPNFSFFPDNAGGGILCFESPNASITIKNSTIQHNNAWNGGGIECSQAGPLIENCEIIHNNAVMGGAIEMFSSAYTEIVNSTLAYNYAEASGGAVACWESNFPKFTGNIIIHNTCLSDNGGGIVIKNVNNFQADNNLIAYNTSARGGGIYCEDANGSLTNNTIAYNEATIYGGGILFQSSEECNFWNTIIYFNEENGMPNQVCLVLGPNLNFYYCDIQDDTAGFSGGGSFEGDYENCIDADPLFVDALNDDFNLSWTNYPQPDTTQSPCIDMGCPGLPGPDGSCKDIGVYQFYQQLDVPEALDGISISLTSFEAVWTEAYGALGYYLDVAEDYTFLDTVFFNQVVYGTSFMVEDLLPDSEYFYRVRSFNTALTSVYSNYMNNPVSIEESNYDDIKIYSFSNKLYIKTNQKITVPGNIWVYNTTGQLLVNQQVYSGSNTIDLNVSEQIVIVKVILEGKVYQQKLLIN